MLNSLFILLIAIAKADSQTCIKGEIRQTTNQVTTSAVAEYCFNEDKNVLISSNCKKQDCLAFDRNKTYKLEEIFSQRGNPGFKLCRLLDGHPEIIEFKVNNQWYSLDRCVFKDGTYADTGQLVKFYLIK